MAERVIDAELVEERFVVCTQCHHRNRLYKRTVTGVYRCGACRAPLANPFLQSQTRMSAPRVIGYVASGLALLVLIVFVAGAFKSRSALDQTSIHSSIPQSRSAIPLVIAPTVAAPATEAPANNAILFNSFPGSAARGELTVSNGTSRHAIAKLIDKEFDKKILSFAVRSGQKSTIYAIPDGSYGLIFAFGDRLYQGTDRFVSPQGFSKFAKPMAFSTKITADAMYWDKLSVTLHPVITGNAKTESISRKDFERY